MTQFHKTIDVSGVLGFTQVVVPVEGNNQMSPSHSKSNILAQYYSKHYVENIKQDPSNFIMFLPLNDFLESHKLLARPLESSGLVDDDVGDEVLHSRDLNNFQFAVVKA